MALAVEATFGYPDRLYRLIGHPVTWIGAGIAVLDARFNRESDPPARRRFAGFLVVLVVILVPDGVAAAFNELVERCLPTAAAALVLGVVASTCLAQRSLHQHVRAVADALDEGGIDAGRQAVAMIVGRDTAAFDAAAVSRAAIESLAENFADGIVAPAFWLALLGLPGGIVYKAVNTADSMIGHRTTRHAAFGFAAAKTDDLLNWPAARLAALAIVGAAATMPDASSRAAWRIMLRDARGHPSPNAGWPEAAMAGALGIKLGGPRAYGGHFVDDAAMGDGDGVVDAGAIRRALKIYRRACALVILVTVMAAAMAVAR